MAGVPIAERNQDATVYVGGLDEKVAENILWELFVQAGPVVNVHMPKDRVSGSHQGYGFVEFLCEPDADYAIKVLNMIKLYGKPIRVNKASAHQKNLDVGANVFIGNLDPEVDEKLLFDTFSAFGVILQTPKVMRDPDTGNSKGYAFVNFASFDASDAAIEAMNGQHLCNRPISVSYAFKKDAKGERHGSAAERLLAAQNPLSHSDRPHQLFADAPAIPGQIMSSNLPNATSAGLPPPPPPPPVLMMPPPPPPVIANGGMPNPMMMGVPPPPPPPSAGMLNGTLPGTVPTQVVPGMAPPGMNPLYFASPEDPTGMMTFMHWQMSQAQFPGMSGHPAPPPPPPPPGIQDVSSVGGHLPPLPPPPPPPPPPNMGTLFVPPPPPPPPPPPAEAV